MAGKKKARFTRRSLGDKGLVYHDIPEASTIRMYIPGREKYIDIEWNSISNCIEITGSDHLVVCPRLSNVIHMQVER